MFNIIIVYLLISYYRLNVNNLYLKIEPKTLYISFIVELVTFLYHSSNPLWINGELVYSGGKSATNSRFACLNRNIINSK